MPQSAPDFTTAIITISFLLVLAGIAFVIKNKSGSIKKIIKKTRKFRSITAHAIEKWLSCFCV